jgi:hypothetical protein
MRRLRVLKKRGWIRVVGGSLEESKTLQGAFYETTDLAPGEPVSNQSQGGVGNTSSDLLKAAKEQLKKGKSHAA